ncbi:BQ2448_3353 [Microbotryum intermedium]|uniref:BQ2448_3353 protein n=1 Tax=Microbotryum intermedium TaxID=269621 RepID=A0A238FEQ9_9BASI|nr:BQ2448_3353 [Microbotryum intermedium]
MFQSLKDKMSHTDPAYPATHSTAEFAEDALGLDDAPGARDLQGNQLKAHEDLGKSEMYQEGSSKSSEPASSSSPNNMMRAAAETMQPTKNNPGGDTDIGDKMKDMSSSLVNVVQGENT